ncbi:Hypothetical predicted protein [Mytilus galloprovincialis]|uniref:Uncharacterized protein n=1 Tax=Mytilus galloprovincialis TaxID=29158 RepID=A0A8B6DB85_MYTGA|nr:Hypothetical predicted protein [Mytilus galloprovincialis]
MADASCSLPQDLRNKVWEYSYTSVSDSSKKVINLDIKTTTLQNSAINLEFQGTIINQWTCINSLDVSNTTTVVVFRSDNSYSKVPLGDNYRLYLCMKLTRITADLYYFYLLSDKKTDIKPNERAFESTDTDPISSTVCQYTDSPPKIRTLRKQGTNDVLPNDASLCEPWDSACDVDDMCDPNPCQNNGTCVDLSDSFNCTCAPGWEDDNCTTVMTCDDPKIVPHTTIISSGNELDDTITFSCAVGYEHISGDSVITCRSDGNWEGSPINCSEYQMHKL